MHTTRTFISVLATDNYLPGFLVLNSSLRSVGSQYPLHVLLTPNISKTVLEILDKNFISYSRIPEQINNPTKVHANHRWFSTYSKLAIFDQEQYEKIVYLDLDMLILRPIDELFEYPHMSATNAGSMLPRKQDRRHQELNSGLMVIEPSHTLFNDMLDKVGKIENLEIEYGTEMPIRGSDQDFINAYYPKWPDQKHLHLDHKYNIFHYHLDEYNKLFGYSIGPGPSPVSIIHYASFIKPWNIAKEEISRLESTPDKYLELEAIRMWIEHYKNIVADLS